MPNTKITIAGAGPTGLAAGLFLTQYKIPVRIFDKHLSPAPYSKAFGVNARTLTLLESTGITEKLLQQGHKMYAVNIWRNNQRIVRLDLSKSPSKYNFMLIHSQAKTEQLLAEALNAKGIQVERGVCLQDIKLDQDRFLATLEIKYSNDQIEKLDTSCLLAADGAHSTIRTALGIDFLGSSYSEQWYFKDLELETALNQDEAHVTLLDNGALFMLRLEGNLWRIGGNMSNLLDLLPPSTQVGNIIWDTSFTISHKVTEEFSRGPVYLAGDAAHIHSPMGARGMNLGIEDAYVFAMLAANNRLSEYAQMRCRVVTKVVNTVAKMSELPRGKNKIAQFVRSSPLFLKLLVPIMAPTLRRWVLGLDHQL